MGLRSAILAFATYLLGLALGILLTLNPAPAAESYCRPIADEIASYESLGAKVTPVPGGKDAVHAYAGALPNITLPEVNFTGMAIADAGGILVVAILIEGDCSTYSIRLPRERHEKAMRAVSGI